MSVCINTAGSQVQVGGSGLGGVCSELRSAGFASLSLDSSSVARHSSHFSNARGPLDLCGTEDSVIRVNETYSGKSSSTSSSTSSSSTFTGFHSMGGLSAYNACREGFVFSNGDLMHLPAPYDNFYSSCDDFRREGCEIAKIVYNELEKHLKLPNNYFEQQFGQLEATCQWHIKRYDPSSPSDVLLPMHTDPSLISVVLHDCPPSPGCLGLEVLDEDTKGWKEPEGCGHGRATVLVGSVMEKITCGYLRAARHR